MSDGGEAMRAIQDNLNGAGILQGNPEVVAFVRGLLQKAEAGELTGIAAALCIGAGGITAGSAGGNPASLVLGLEQLKLLLVQSAFAPKKGSGLVVPGRRM